MKREENVEMTADIQDRRSVKRAKGKRFLITFVCIFLALIIGLGSGFGIYIALRNKNSAVRLGNITVSEGSARFLVSTFKGDYITLLSKSGISAYDSEGFWSSEAEGGATYGELLSEYIRARLVSVVSSAEIYTKTLGKTDARAVAEATANQILSLRFSGDEDSFNEESQKLGFSFDDYTDAIELLYSELAAMEAIYGAEGENLSQYPEQCVEYLNTFARVQILFLMENDRYSRDENGDYIANPADNGETALTHEMSESEKAAREELIEKLTGYVNEGRMTEDTVKYYQPTAEGAYEKSDGDPYWLGGVDLGYYFSTDSEETKRFAKRYEGVVEAAFDMEVGEYRIVECPTIGGVCLLYRCALSKTAYANTDNPFFTDFYSNATPFLYQKVIDSYSDDVTFGKKFDNIDPVSQKRSKSFIVNTFVK